MKRKTVFKEGGFFVSKDVEDEKTPASFKKTEKPADTREKLAAHRVGRGSEPRDKRKWFFVSKDVEDEKTPASFKRTEKPADTSEKLAAHGVGRGWEARNPFLCDITGG